MNINFGTLFGNNMPTQLQNNELVQSAETPLLVKDGEQGEKIADLSTLKPGEFFEGMVEDIVNTEVKIALAGDYKVNATMNEAVNLNIGEHVIFQVKENANSQTVIRPVQYGNNDNELIDKALSSAGLSSNEKNKFIVKELINQGQPLNKDVLMNTLRNVNKFPGQDIASIVKLEKHNITVNEGNIKMMESYSANEGGISDNLSGVQKAVTELLKQIDEQINTLEQKSDGVTQGASGEVAQEVANDVQQKTTDNVSQKIIEDMPQKATESMSEKTTESVPQKVEESVSQKVTEDVSQKLAEDVPQKAIESVPQKVTEDVPQKVIEDVPQKTTEDVPQKATEGVPQKVTEDVPQKVTEDVPQKVIEDVPQKATEGVPQKVTEDVPQKATEDVPQKATEGVPQKVAEDVPQKASQNATQGVSVSEASTHKAPENVSHDAIRDIPQKASEEVLEKGKFEKENFVPKENDTKQLEILKNLRQEIEDIANQKYMPKPEEYVKADNPKKVIEKVYENISKQFERLENAVKSATEQGVISEKSAAYVLDNVKNTSQNFNFMNDLNNMAAYVQIPVKLNNEDTEGELYVFNKDKKKTVEEGINAFLHFDLENLGATDIRIKLKSKSLRIDFSLEDEQSMRIVDNNIEELKEKLDSKGYIINCSVSTSKEEQRVIEKMFENDQNQKVIKRYSFDIRT